MVSPMTEDTIHFSHRMWRNEVGAGQEASLLLASFHGTGGYVRHSHQQSYPAMNPGSYNNDPGETRSAHRCNMNKNVTFDF